MAPSTADAGATDGLETRPFTTRGIEVPVINRVGETCGRLFRRGREPCAEQSRAFRRGPETRAEQRRLLPNGGVRADFHIAAC